MEPIPETMRSLVAPRKCGPEEYEVIHQPLPVITKPNQILIRTHAGSIMTGDCQRVEGFPILRQKFTYPMKMGAEGAGVVVAVGKGVKTLKVGDEVYGLEFSRPAFTEPDAGFCSEYAIAQEKMMLLKPSHVPFEDAAALSGFTVTAYQAFKKGLKMLGESSLEGKTVFIPAALSGTGFTAIQVAKNVLGASKIISTVSTPKMKLVEKLLPGMVDQLLDYQTQNIVEHVPKGSVDVVYNTQWNTISSGIPLLKPETGLLVSVTGIPNSEIFTDLVGPDQAPFWLSWILDLCQYWYRFLLRGTRIKYTFHSGNPEIREDLESVGEMIALGKVKAVMRVVDLSNIEAIREECKKVSTGKGGIGRLVIRTSA